MVDAVNRAITVGHSLISLALALTGEVFMWLIARQREYRAERDENPASAEDPLA